MSEALVFSKVEKGFGSVKVFNSLNFRVERGEIVAFLGANGAGKSTFLSLASGLLKPDAGEVRVLNSTAGSFPLKRRVRTLTQELAFPQQLTVKEIVSLAQSHFGASWPQTLLEALQLDSILDRRTGGLSGGESRRLGLAITLLGDPELILLDEPTSSLDLKGQRAIQEVLIEHLRRTGATLIFSSHRMSEVEKLADRITVINRGRILADGPTAEIRREFGMAKVHFVSELPIDKLESARALLQTNLRYEALGPDADAILRELILKHGKAREFSVQHAPLEEIILQLWSRELP